MNAASPNGSAPTIESLTPRPVAECTSAEVAECLNQVFRDYVVPVRLSPESYERRMRGEDLDPFASRVFARAGAPVAALLVSRRGWTSRVAAMGVAPQFRARRLGRALMEGAIRDARERGDHCMILEVFEQNTRAVRLYASLGFRPRRRLVGYRWQGSTAPGEIPEALTEMDPLRFARMVAAECGSDLPWALAPETLSAASAPARAFSLAGHAAALVADTEREVLVLSGIAVERAHRRRGLATRLLHALQVAFPGRSWIIPPVVPEDLAHRFLAGQGWEPQVFSQYEMRLELTPQAS